MNDVLVAGGDGGELLKGHTLIPIEDLNWLHRSSANLSYTVATSESDKEIKDAQWDYKASLTAANMEGAARKRKEGASRAFLMIAYQIGGTLVDEGILVKKDGKLFLPARQHQERE